MYLFIRYIFIKNFGFYNQNIPQEEQEEEQEEQEDEYQQEEEQLKTMNLQIQDENISVNLQCIKQNEDTVFIKTQFSSQYEIENLVFQCAVLKYLKLQMNPISGNRIDSMTDIKQSMTIVNSLQGQKQILIKTKIQYYLDNEQFTLEKTINEIPIDF